MEKSRRLTACVFCGSSHGASPQYQKSAQELGSILGKSEIKLIYGGGSEGLMGSLASEYSVYRHDIKGIVPFFLKDIIKHDSGAQHIFTENLGERKKLMLDEADFFIAMPGGIGTFDEIFEILATHQLNRSNKPMGLLNVEDFFTPFLDLLAHLKRSKFIRKEYSQDLILECSPSKLVQLLIKKLP